MIFQNPALSDDSLRTVIHTVLKAPEYQWSDLRPRMSLLGRWFTTIGEWLGRLRDSNPAAADLFFWCLVALLLAIFVHGGWIMYQTVRRAGAPPAGAGPTVSSSIRDERWYQRRSAELAAQGRYAEAMQAAFTGVMLRLDAHNVLRFHPGKTPREYAREAKLADEDKRTLLDAVVTLYSCVYAGRDCSPELYREWLMSLGQEWHARTS